jgi:uncharacterized membrane protein
MTVFNSCDTPIYIETGANINSVTNQTTPTVKVSPGAVVLTAREQIPINVTVDMPANATPGTQWVGGVAAIESSNSTKVGAANLQVGVRETLKITALSQPLNFYEFELLAISVIIIVVLLMLIIYLAVSKHNAIKDLRKNRNLPATKKIKPTRHRRR